MPSIRDDRKERRGVQARIASDIQGHLHVLLGLGGKAEHRKPVGENAPVGGPFDTPEELVNIELLAHDLLHAGGARFERERREAQTGRQQRLNHLFGKDIGSDAVAKAMRTFKFRFRINSQIFNTRFGSKLKMSSSNSISVTPKAFV